MHLTNLPVDRALKKLGANIRQARLRRCLTRQEFAEHMGVSCSTAQRLENGEPGVALYTMLSCLQALQLLDDFNRLLDPAQDTVGLVAQEAYLPKRGRRAGLDMADHAHLPSEVQLLIPPGNAWPKGDAGLDVSLGEMGRVGRLAENTSCPRAAWCWRKRAMRSTHWSCFRPCAAAAKILRETRSSSGAAWRLEH